MHSEADEVDNKLGNGDDEAREIDFVEERTVGGESRCRIGDATLKITPADGASQKEEHRRDFACFDASNLVEDNGEHDAGDERLDDIPRGAENGLFVAGDKITMNEAKNEFAIFPDFFPRDMQELVLGGDDGGPVLILGG